MFSSFIACSLASPPSLLAHATLATVYKRRPSYTAIYLHSRNRTRSVAYAGRRRIRLLTFSVSARKRDTRHRVDDVSGISEPEAEKPRLRPHARSASVRFTNLERKM